MPEMFRAMTLLFVEPHTTPIQLQTDNDEDQFFSSKTVLDSKDTLDFRARSADWSEEASVEADEMQRKNKKAAAKLRILLVLSIDTFHRSNVIQGGYNKMSMLYKQI